MSFPAIPLGGYPGPAKRHHVGQFYFQQRGDSVLGMYVCLPKPEGGLVWNYCPFVNPNPERTTYQWDGNRQTPTLTPEIVCKEYWRGTLTGGQFNTS